MYFNRLQVCTMLASLRFFSFIAAHLSAMDWFQSEVILTSASCLALQGAEAGLGIDP